MFRLFRFSGILGQPREVHPKFRNEIPENACPIRSDFPNFRSSGKRPRSRIGRPKCICYACHNWHYYMASSASRQDERNRGLSLATRAGKITRSGLPAVSRKENFPKSHIIDPLLTKFVRSRLAGYWPRSIFFSSLWTSTSSQSINTQKTELGQYPATLTSHLVNNPYLTHL